MGLQFLSLEPARAREALDALARGNFTLTAAQHNAFGLALLGLRDAVADPARVLRFDMPRVPDAAGSPYPLSLPTAPYQGPDRALRGTQVPVLGLVPPPAHWRTGAARSETETANEPAWIRGTDGERRALYGALTVALEGMAARDRTSTGARSGDLSDTARVILGTLPWGFLVVAESERGETDRTRIREEQNSARFAAQCAQVVQLYTERLKVYKETGTMPPASAAETAGNPYTPDGRPAPGSPSARGLDYWLSLTGDAVKVGLYGGAVAGGIALAVYVWGKVRAASAAARGLTGARAA